MQVPTYEVRNGRYDDVDLLRFSTAGSVDDGKSTLIGRLLYDSKAAFEDQLDELRHTSRRRGEEGINLALLTDGLRAEREQGITIDVAYRYFATPRRKFIISDTPGHLQYTRNMVTGASTTDLAIILIDARQGMVSQSRRHAFIAALLQIGHVVVAVNKMDTVAYREDVFNEITTTYQAFARQLGIEGLVFIPISALHGDNVVTTSENMLWYQGPTLLEFLETVPVRRKEQQGSFRFPVQYVIRPNQHFRGFAGRITSGIVRTGDAITVLPSRMQSRIRSIVTFDGEKTHAAAGESVVLTLDDEIDISRGDMIVQHNQMPRLDRRLHAMVCWMNEHPLQLNRIYLLRHGTATLRAQITRVVHRQNVDTLEKEEAETLGLNDIALVEVTTTQPLPFDAYTENRESGSFILIDPGTNETVAAGMIHETDAALTQGVSAVDSVLSQKRAIGRQVPILWFSGFERGVTQILTRAIEAQLFEAGHRAAILDEQEIRERFAGIVKENGISSSDHFTEIVRLFLDQGFITLCTAAPESGANIVSPRIRFSSDLVIEICSGSRNDKPASTGDGHWVPVQPVEEVYVFEPGILAEAPDLVLDATDPDLHRLAEEVLRFVASKVLLPDQP